ncbi:hypothetical protein KUTeg_011801 [Tegillarca granosa]|uniref:Fibropellin-1 n=1 Tax=Tegillarca granosa TaxID=220873 RepID=A0ABQ9EXP7_TEGGR|nr:hypothetical protein KUTeg_011801 [Tegillarca granosa]
MSQTYFANNMFKAMSCPLGTYFFNDLCVDCPEGQYQDIAGQLQCKTCVAGKSPSSDRTICIDICPEGFINDTQGQVPFCIPCSEDTYWLNATYCQTCPPGYRTFSTGAKNQSDCKDDSCRMVRESGNFFGTNGDEYVTKIVTSVEACERECMDDTRCKSAAFTGGVCILYSVNTVAVPYASATLRNGVCSVIGHIKVCTCNKDVSCRMIRESGNFLGTNGDEYVTKIVTSVEACEIECMDDTRCKSVAFTGGVCILYSVNTVAVPYASASTLLRKCETDAVDSCINNTDCGSYGMCQDGLGTFVDGKIQERSSFKCLCQQVGEFIDNRCNRKLDLCSPNPCENNGKCQSFGEIRRVCECLPGYSGENCSINIGFSGDRCQIVPDICTLDPRCTNGLCYNNYDNYTAVCVCEKPYQLGSNGKCVLSDPCMGVTCINGSCMNGKCECQTGYEGSKCQHDIDDCKKGPCKNGAKCIDGYNSSQCICLQGYEGLFCEKDVDDCVDKCDNMTTVRCEDKVDDYECICMKGYTGKNCTEEIIECSSYPCRHGSECVDLLGDYKCNCTEGWTGKDCEIPVNYCQNNPCRYGGYCYNLIDGYFCKCMPGTRGETCSILPEVCRVVTPCTNSDYTGNSCNLIKDSCKEDICKNGGTCKTKDLGFECICTPDYSGTTCEVYTDPCNGSSKCHNTAVCKSENDRYLCLCTEGRTLTADGCKDTYEDWDMFFDPKLGGHGAWLRTPFMLGTQELSIAFWTRFKLLIGQNLNGRISRVTVWKTVLSFLDIVKASAEPNYRLQGTLVQGWTNYMFSEGSERKYPSKVKQMVCDLGLEDAYCTNKYKEKPQIIRCPSNKEFLSSKRLTEIEDLILNTDIVFNSSNHLHVWDNFPPGRYFGYGIKSYTAFAIDDYGNSAECTVRVVVKRAVSCIATAWNYKPPFYCDGMHGSICDVQCKNDTKLLSQPVPKIIKCGILGSYYTKKLRQMKRRIEIKLQYRFQVACTSSFLKSLQNDISTTFNSQLSEWTGICIFVNSVCETIALSVTCKNLNEFKCFIHNNDLDIVSKNGVQYTPTEAFRVLNVGASVLVTDTVQIEELKYCEPGYAIVGQNCVQCPAGSYYDSSIVSCKFCGIGQYQNLSGQSSCSSCDRTKTTLQVGSSKSSDCVDEEGKTYCLGCPVGKKTNGTGSNSSSDCLYESSQDGCVAGTELSPDRYCVSCPRGFYRSLAEDKCTKCPDNFTTPSSGADSHEFCHIRICYAGNFLNVTTNDCQPCPIGYYQPESLQDFCHSCEPSYSTKDEGNVNKTSCVCKYRFVLTVLSFKKMECSCMMTWTVEGGIYLIIFNFLCKIQKSDKKIYL